MQQGHGRIQTMGKTISKLPLCSEYSQQVLCGCYFLHGAYITVATVFTPSVEHIKQTQCYIIVYHSRHS